MKAILFMPISWLNAAYCCVCDFFSMSAFESYLSSKKTLENLTDQLSSQRTAQLELNENFWPLLFDGRSLRDIQPFEAIELAKKRTDRVLVALQTHLESRLGRCYTLRYRIDVDALSSTVILLVTP